MGFKRSYRTTGQTEAVPNTAGKLDAEVEGRRARRRQQTKSQSLRSCIRPYRSEKTTLSSQPRADRWWLKPPRAIRTVESP